MQSLAKCSPFAPIQAGTSTDVLLLFLDDDTFFDNEWMTSKIDLSSLAEFDNSLNLVSAEIQSPAIVTALRDSKPSTMAKIDVIDTNAVNIDKSKDNGPISPEQHVPDDEKAIEDHIQDFLNSYLEAAKTSVQDVIPSIPSSEDDVFIVETTNPTKLPLKRKLSDPAPQEPKPKVKTPEQKQRKRVQNRNAATRYRSKKRSEQEVLNSRCTELEHENADLRDKIKSKQQEIEYLKNLIIDVFSKKHKAV